MSVKRLSKSKARIKAKKKGTTYVKIKVGSYYIKEKVKIYHLKSSVDKAIKQAKSFRKRKIKYSQPKRMMKNYADCSSFVWRSYRKGRVYIGSHSYAPTAASMAKTLSRKKRVIGYKKAKISKMKPGDLIFCTGAKNGRYRGIYHVQMYLGGNEIIDVNGYYQHFGGKYIRGMIARPVR